MMAGINTKAVHRTNFLLGHPWGAGFQYDEMQMLAGPPAEGGAGGMGGFSFGAAGMPKPGEGPTREERETGYFDILVIAEDQRRTHASARRSKATWTPATARPPRCWARAPSASPATFPATASPAVVGPPPPP